MVGVCYLATIIIYIISTVNCTNRSDCPASCACLGYFVDCSSKRLTNVPKIPNWTLKLELNYNQLKEIKALTFKGLEKLTVLKLKRDQITILRDGAFYGLTSIHKLILDNNHVQVISKSWLYGLTSLKELSIDHNNISSIETDAWKFCVKLKKLNLAHNRLESIGVETFGYLIDLETLDLSYNNLTRIEEGAFMHLPNLRNLYLSNNKISYTIEDANGVFRGLINLNRFYIIGNNIKSINKNAFIGLKNVTHLNLINNNIASIQKNAFFELDPQVNISMNTKNLLCDCNLLWFYEWLNGRKMHINAECAYPEWFRGQSLLKVPGNNFTCDELPKPRLIKEPELEIMALKGENITLQCTAMSSSNSAMTFQWKKDNVELPNTQIVTSRSKDGKNTETVSKLNIENVQHSNAGIYQCVASNEFGTTYSQKSNISVLIFPTFIKTPQNVTIEKGNFAKLVCAADGEPTPEIAWQKDGGNDFPAARERRMVVMPTDDAFFIMNVKPSDMGIYSCTAHNAAGTIVVNATLTIQEKPTFVKRMEDKEVTAGQVVVVQCMAGGAPKPTVQWSKDGELIRATERHFFTAEEQLMIIVDTVPGDSGRYECRLNNSLGQESGFSRLNVKPAVLSASLVTTDMMGIIIITVVCCAVCTSIIWLVIIYQTRRRPSDGAHAAGPSFELGEKALVHFTDNVSDRSSCKDSGTGDSAKRSNDDLTPTDYNLIINEEAVNGWGVARAPSLVYLQTETSTPLLHSENYARETNHDRVQVHQTNDEVSTVSEVNDSNA